MGAPGWDRTCNLHPVRSWLGYRTSTVFPGLKTIINNEKQHIAECTVYIPGPLKFLLQQKKGCKRVYNVLSNITNMHIKTFDKWGEILNNDYN